MNPPPVQYVTTSDGYNLAYTVSGDGRPFVLMPLALHHIELSLRYDQRIVHWIDGLTKRFRLVRYDGRGQGLSTRGLTQKHTMRDQVLDLGTVVDGLGLEGFVLMAFYNSSHSAIRYAVEHPERVRALILVSASASMADYPLVQLSLAQAAWDVFLRIWAPDGLSNEELDQYLTYFRQTATMEDFALNMRILSTSDVSDLLPLVRVPTLVMYPRDFFGVSEAAVIKLSAAIPGARFVLFDGRHIGDAFQPIQAIDSFMAALPSVTSAGLHPPDRLSQREVAVLRLIAAGKTNNQIADELVITLNTAQRHVSNILAKTGLANRTEAAAYAHRNDIA